MNCAHYCHQGRQPCPTPYSCGIYSIDSDKPVLQTANSDGSNPDLPITMHDTPLDHARTLFLAIALVAFAGCVGLIVMAVLR